MAFPTWYIILLLFYTLHNFIRWLNISDNRADIKAEKNPLKKGVLFGFFYF